MIDWDRCAHCNQTGCIDETVQHLAHCPSVTDLWPVTEAGDICCACDQPFTVGDVYTHIKDPSHWMMANLPPGVAVSGFSVCLGCAALDRRPA